MYYLIGADQKEYGPVAADEVRAWIAEGRANGQTLARLEGGPWKPLSTFPEFAATLGAAPQPPPVPLAQASLTGRAPETNGMAVAGLVMGILSMTIGLVCCGLVFNILGIIFSSVALSQLKRSQQTGRNLAIVGLVLSLLGLLFEIIKIVVFGAMGLLKEIMQQH
jgi:hypothetical protein